MNSGIYAIINSANGKVYIGSSSNIKRRWKEHRTYLTSGTHKNQHLQSSYNKYGTQSFSFVVMEACESETLTEREQFWMDSIGSVKNGYNICPAANSLLGYKHTDQAKKNMSDSAKAKKPIGADSRKRQAEKLRGQKTQTAESKLKIGAAHKGKIVSQETRLKMSISAKRRGYNRRTASFSLVCS
jgi:group I intron endonuclease